MVAHWTWREETYENRGIVEERFFLVCGCCVLWGFSLDTFKKKRGSCVTRDQDDEDLPPGWDFEKTVKTSNQIIEWDDVLKKRNKLQAENIALYGAIQRITPTYWEKIKWWTTVSTGLDAYDLVFKHRGVYEFYKSLAIRLGVSVGRAADMLVNDEEQVMEELGVETGKSLQVTNINLEPSNDKSVSKEELEEIVEKEKEKVLSKDDEGVEGVSDSDFSDIDSLKE